MSSSSASVMMQPGWKFPGDVESSGQPENREILNESQKLFPQRSEIYEAAAAAGRAEFSVSVSLSLIRPFLSQLFLFLQQSIRVVFG